MPSHGRAGDFRPASGSLEAERSAFISRDIRGRSDSAGEAALATNPLRVVSPSVFLTYRNIGAAQLVEFTSTAMLVRLSQEPWRDVCLADSARTAVDQPS